MQSGDSALLLGGDSPIGGGASALGFAPGCCRRWVLGGCCCPHAPTPTLQAGAERAGRMPPAFTWEAAKPSTAPQRGAGPSPDRRSGSSPVVQSVESGSVETQRAKEETLHQRDALHERLSAAQLPSQKIGL